MDKKEDQRIKIQQKINKLKQKESHLKNQERKQRTRQLIEWGGLIEKAQLGFLQTNQLYGALLSLQEDSKNSKTLQEWEQKGGIAFHQQRSPQHKEPYQLITQEKPDAQVRTFLKAHGFQWNKIRQTWEGLIAPDIIKDLQTNLKALNPVLQKIEAA